MTQNSALRDYLNNHGSITRIESFQELGITNLWQRIRELEASGYLIRREDGVEVRDRRGATCRVTRYHKDTPVSPHNAPQGANDQPVALASSPRSLPNESRGVTVPDVLRVDGWDYKGRPMVRYVEGFGNGHPPDQDHLYAKRRAGQCLLN